MASLCPDNATFPNSTIGLAAAVSCVANAYEVLLDTEADPGGLQYWSNWLVTTGEAAISLNVEILVAAPGSLVFPNTPDGLIAAGYLFTYLYDSVLNRPPSASELQYWQDRAVTSGATKAQLVAAFNASTYNELHPKPAPAPAPPPQTVTPPPQVVTPPPVPVQQPSLPPASASQIESWYCLYLCRPADLDNPNGAGYWLTQPDAAHTQAAIAATPEAQAVIARGGCSVPPPQQTSSKSQTPLLIAGAGVAAVVGIILATKPASPVRPNATRVTPAA